MQPYVAQYLTKQSYYQISVLPLPSAYERRRPKLLITLRDQTNAPYYAPNNCSACARSRSLYSYATAAPLRYADSSCLYTCLQQQRSSCNIYSACGSLDLDLSNLYYAS
jgi:hypothetical protein